MSQNIPPMNAGWHSFYRSQSNEPYFKQLIDLVSERRKEKSVLPAEDAVFRSLVFSSPQKIRCLVIGQDPYPQKENAMGLSFSIPSSQTKIPSSLLNIQKEIHRSFNTPAVVRKGDLTPWAEQGVLLLNTVLTVDEGDAGSHIKRMGWETFTTNLISYLNEVNTGIVCLAWGKHAHKVSSILDTNKHHVIKTSHPSGLGHYRSGKDFSAFTGSRCFSEANEWLVKKGKEPIKWAL